MIPDGNLDELDRLAQRLEELKSEGARLRQEIADLDATLEAPDASLGGEAGATRAEAPGD